MLIGYARISKADGSQSLDLQRDALREAGVAEMEVNRDARIALTKNEEYIQSLISASC